MTTAPSDLIEEVAMAILRSHGHLQEQVEFLRDRRVDAWHRAISDARASATVIIEACAKDIAELRKLLHAQHEVIDIGREDAVYHICEVKIRALIPAAKPEGA